MNRDDQFVNEIVLQKKAVHFATANQPNFALATEL